MKPSVNKTMYDSLEVTRNRLMDRIAEEDLSLDDEIQFFPLGVKEAIGSPSPSGEYPLEQGKETLMEARYNGARGQAFTSIPAARTLMVRDIFSISLDTPNNRALCIAGINALASLVGATEKTIHCRDKGPTICGGCMAERLMEEYGPEAHVGIVGFNPGIVSHVVETYGSEQVHLTDLNPENIGTERYGVPVWDGHEGLERLCAESTVVLATGSSLGNNTLDTIRIAVGKTGRDLIYFGTTIAAVASILGYRRWCFEAS